MEAQLPMFKRLSLLAALAVIAVGSAASARTYYEESTVYDPYYGPVTQVNKIHVHHYDDSYYYRDDPSVGGFVDRSGKTGVGIAGKAAKETVKAIF
jgi:hypothetical protein